MRITYLLTMKAQEQFEQAWLRKILVNLNGLLS